jgi:hypothetical protein
MGMSSYTVFLLWQIVCNRQQKESKNWNTLLENSQSKKFTHFWTKKILIGENFGHISIKSSKFEGRFNPIFENPVAN